MSNNDSLASVLQRCSIANKQYIQEAEEYLPLIQEAVISASSEIEKVRDKCRRLYVKDPVITENLDVQLKKISDEFLGMYYEVKYYFEEKKKEKAIFNITLFGRTMVGKSTLMAILTHSNDEAIGNGAQRTTRDTRQYSWQGLTVTDVPGINAFDGEEDEQLAKAAARKADLIVFMINDDQTEAVEADWLCKF